jgi:hypothetical protein
MMTRVNECQRWPVVCDFEFGNAFDFLRIDLSCRYLEVCTVNRILTPERLSQQGERQREIQSYGVVVASDEQE